MPIRAERWQTLPIAGKNH
jgi:hypothetical protein